MLCPHIHVWAQYLKKFGEIGQQHLEDVVIQFGLVLWGGGGIHDNTKQVYHKTREDKRCLSQDKSNLRVLSCCLVLSCCCFRHACVAPLFQFLTNSNQQHLEDVLIQFLTNSNTNPCPNPNPYPNHLPYPNLNHNPNPNSHLLPNPCTFPNP